MKLTTLLFSFTLMIHTTYAFIAPRNTTSTNYRQIIQKTAAMVSDRTAQRIVQKEGLRILNVTWEDTGRYKISSVGPNISDMTIQVQHTDKRGHSSVTCMPVIRFPNFSDKTGDIASDKFYLLVGNEKGKKLRKVLLKDFLANMRKYLSKPNSWKGANKSLLAKRDSHMLVSAQACFLPIPKKGEATFNPVLFNYQSYEGDPAVLTILATREGTSVTVIDNKRDGFQAGYTWGQRLFFNQKGERASLTGQRLSDYEQEQSGTKQCKPSTEKKASLNMVMLIQVPLKQRKPMRRMYEDCEMASAMPKCKKSAPASSVENAVIGHGEVEGPFTEIDNLSIERDPAFPIRITVQFYKATDNGVVSDGDVKEIAEQINRVYDEADYVGSLVVGGNTNRPTEYIGDKEEPQNWWQAFWERHNKNMHNNPQDEKGIYFGW